MSYGISKTNHGHKLAMCSKVLSENIRRTDQIITHLVTKNVLTSEEHARLRLVNSQCTVFDFTNYLIEFLGNKKVAAYKCFLDALTTTGQQHLYEALEQGVSVNVDHSEVLISNYKFLKENLIVETTLLAKLLESEVLDLQEVADIKKETTNHMRVDKLLDIIKRTPEKQYQLFLQAVGGFVTEQLEAHPKVTKSQEESSSCNNTELQLPFKVVDHEADTSFRNRITPYIEGSQTGSDDFIDAGVAQDETDGHERISEHEELQKKLLESTSVCIERHPAHANRIYAGPINCAQVQPSTNLSNELNVNEKNSNRVRSQSSESTGDTIEGVPMDTVANGESSSSKVSNSFYALIAFPLALVMCVFSAKVSIKSEVQSSLIIVGLNVDGRSMSSHAYQTNLQHDNITTTLINEMPSLMSVESQACVGGKNVYVTGTGGYDDNELWELDMESKKWSQLSNLITGRRRHCAVIVGSQLCVLGGWDVNSETLSSVECYNMATNKWHRAGSLIEAVQDASCVAYNNSVYVFGGHASKPIDHIQVYNIVTQQSTLLDSRMPDGYKLIRAVLWESSVILLHHNTCLVYNFETKIWLDRKQFKTGVSHFGLALHNQTVYIAGGCISARNTSNELIWKFRDDIKSVSLQDILEDKPVIWKHHDKIPQAACIHAYSQYSQYL